MGCVCVCVCVYRLKYIFQKTFKKIKVFKVLAFFSAISFRTIQLSLFLVLLTFLIRIFQLFLSFFHSMKEITSFRYMKLLNCHLEPQRISRRQTESSSKRRELEIKDFLYCSH